MSTLRISNIEAKSVPASATIDEKVKITNSSGDTLVFIDGKTSGITTVGINTTDGNIKFDENSNVVITGIITATRFSGEITPTSLEIGSNIKLGNAGVITATSFVGSGANLTGVTADLVNDSSPQLGANLDVNGANILFGDSSAAGTNLNRLKFGAGTDLHIWHNSGTGNSNISAYSGDLYIQGNNGSGTGVNQIAIKSNAAVELNYQGTKKFETSADGIKLYPDASGVLISSGGDTNWTTGAMNVVKLGGNQADIRLGSNYGVRIGISGNNDANEFMIQQDNTNNAYVRNEATNPIRFQTGGSNTRFQIDNSGDCTINDGNLIFANGHGIDFSATGGPTNGTGGSELFKDYEEGSFTPIVRTNNNTTEPSYHHRLGLYTRIGNLVTYVVRITTSGELSTGSGATEIWGLPFAASNWTTGDWPGGADIAYYNNLRGAYGTHPRLLGPYRNSTYVRFHILNNQNDTSYNQYNHIFTNNTIMIAYGQYYTG